MSTPGERFGTHLGRGLTLLWTQGRVAGVRRWVAAGENRFDTGVRWAMVGGPPVLACWWLAAVWWRAAIAAAVVCVLALRAATKAAKAKPQKPAEDISEGRTEVSREDFIALAWDVLDGAPAVHLTTLATHLTDTTGTRWDGAAVRDACKTHHIPVRPKVRDLGGDRVSSGVHRGDLPPLPRPLPEGAQEGPVDGYAAGQDGNTTAPTGPHATTPTPSVARVGDLRITSLQDADNPHRTHVQVADPTRKKATK